MPQHLILAPILDVPVDRTTSEEDLGTERKASMSSRVWGAAGFGGLGLWFTKGFGCRVQGL